MSHDAAKTKFHLVYSLLLLIVIPGILILNTVWWVRQSKQDTDVILQEKTEIISTTFASQIVNELDSPEKADSIVKSIAAQQPDLKELTVYKLDGEYLVPLASSRSDRMQDRLSDLSTIPAWKEKKAVFAFGGDYQGDKLQRIGSMQYPILNDKDSPIGLLNVTLSYANNDQRAEITFHRSIVILFSAVIFIVLLLANHFRMIESTVLLQKIKEIDKMKDDFISMASHELRTPLTAIKGFASLLLEGSGGSLNEKGKRFVEVIMLSTGGLESLVSDMLDVSRIEQGRMTLTIQTVNMGEAVQAVVDQLQISASGKGLGLIHTLPESPIEAKADATRVRQILFNLIGNAVKYTEKGQVSVYYGQGAGKVQLIIEDTGIGMSEEDRKNLFNKFYRIRNDKTEKITGTGLGLWITKQLIEKMGGSIEVASEVGKGSKFTVTLPLA